MPVVLSISVGNYRASRERPGQLYSNKPLGWTKAPKYDTFRATCTLRRENKPEGSLSLWIQ
jgi:hypothetical protein